MRGSRGSSLAEVVIAVLIVAMMAAPIMSVALTSTMSSGRSSRRVAAAESVRRVSEHLKSFVTADTTVAQGPGQGIDGWVFPGDDSTLYALHAGHHDLAPALWVPDLVPYQGRISYDVSLATTTTGPQPDVVFSVTWTEP